MRPTTWTRAQNNRFGRTNKGFDSPDCTAQQKNELELLGKLGHGDMIKTSLKKRGAVGVRT